MLVKDKETAQLINAGAKLDEKIKALTKEFKEIKEDLKERLDKGTYVTKGGRSLTISCSKKYSDIPPEKAKEALRKKRLGRNFLNCVKVNLTELRKLLSDADIKELRVSAGSIIKMSFK